MRGHPIIDRAEAIQANRVEHDSLAQFVEATLSTCGRDRRECTPGGFAGCQFVPSLARSARPSLPGDYGPIPTGRGPCPRHRDDEAQGA